MFKNTVAVVLVTSLCCTFGMALVFAASRPDHKCVCHGSHTGLELDRAAVSRAKAEFAEKIKGLGGIVFETKQELVDYLVSIGYQNIQTTHSLDATIYAAVPKNAVGVLGVEAASDQGIEGEMVILGGEPRYCSKCNQIVIFIITTLISGYLYDSWKVFIDWMKQLLCSVCGTVGEQAKTTVESECPDCGPAGSPRVVESSDSRLTLYCPRLQTTWYEYNPY